MCRDCGCSDPERLAELSHAHSHAHEHGHVHDHAHPHEHHSHEPIESERTLTIQRSLTELNDHLAMHNRERFYCAGVLAVNLMSSPGAGKTRLLEVTLARLANFMRAAVIVGDLATENDAERLRKSGVPIVPVTTGTMCHLEADMIGRACNQLDLNTVDVLFIENVGNLVCPASFDLGEELRVVLMSVTEGEDKPLKYPPMFKAAHTVLLTKTDMAEAAGFDRDAAVENVHRVAPQAQLLELRESNTNGRSSRHNITNRRPEHGTEGAPAGAGYDDNGVAYRELAPIDFSYTAFEPERRKLVALSGTVPLTTLANPTLELIDLFGRGLPDLVEFDDDVRYWRNLGDGRFDMPRLFTDTPTAARLADTGVQLLDANGDGRPDLVVTSGAVSGYWSLDFRAEFSREPFHRYRQAPSFNLEDPEVRLIDLTGDGVTDALRSGTFFECFFNDADEGWLPQNVTRVQRGELDTFPNVTFSDSRVKFADMTGDGLQDIAVVYEGHVDYWPNLAYGRWGRRVSMALAERLPANFDPQRVLLADVDGDGLADLLYVSDRHVTLWINRTGNGWSDARTIQVRPL